MHTLHMRKRGSKLALLILSWSHVHWGSPLLHHIHALLHHRVIRISRGLHSWWHHAHLLILKSSCIRVLRRWVDRLRSGHWSRDHWVGVGEPLGLHWGSSLLLHPWDSCHVGYWLRELLHLHWVRWRRGLYLFLRHQVRGLVTHRVCSEHGVIALQRHCRVAWGHRWTRHNHVWCLWLCLAVWRWLVCRRKRAVK